MRCSSLMESGRAWRVSTSPSRARPQVSYPSTGSIANAARAQTSCRLKSTRRRPGLPTLARVTPRGAGHAWRVNRADRRVDACAGEPTSEPRSSEPDWSATTLWWTDERCVPLLMTSSNYGMTREEILIRHLKGGPPEPINLIKGEIPSFQVADELRRRRSRMRRSPGLRPARRRWSRRPPGVDLPGYMQFKVRDRRATYGPASLEPLVPRVTMTLPTLRSATRIVFLIVGEEKADAVRASFADDVSPDVPTSLIRLSCRSRCTSTRQRRRSSVDPEPGAGVKSARAAGTLTVDQPGAAESARPSAAVEGPCRCSARPTSRSRIASSRHGSKSIRGICTSTSGCSTERA